jgi:hypothetical protein
VIDQNTNLFKDQKEKRSERAQQIAKTPKKILMELYYSATISDMPSLKAKMILMVSKVDLIQ